MGLTITLDIVEKTGELKDLTVDNPKYLQKN